jgi:DNA-binding MarR family transcriptional regulator
LRISPVVGSYRRAFELFGAGNPWNRFSSLSNNRNSDNFFDLPPILIAASSESGKARARATVAMAGLRVAGSFGIEDACQAIDGQGSASALWIELDADAGGPADKLLDHVAADVSHGRYPAVIAAPASMVDRLATHVFDLNMDLIIDADESERTAALAVAVFGALNGQGISDVTADKNAVRLRQLSDEVSRIASTLARLSTGPATTTRALEAEHLGDVPEVSIETIRAIIRARRLRSRYFDEELFADPAWDMLLDLLYAEISNLRVPVSSLCIAAAVPATTGLRWLKTMVQQGIFLRQADPHDGRRVFVELAPHSSQSLRRYFAEVGKVAVV